MNHSYATIPDETFYLAVDSLSDDDGFPAETIVRDLFLGIKYAVQAATTGENKAHQCHIELLFDTGAGEVEYHFDFSTNGSIELSWEGLRGLLKRFAALCQYLNYDSDTYVGLIAGVIRTELATNLGIRGNILNVSRAVGSELMRSLTPESLVAMIDRRLALISYNARDVSFNAIRDMLDGSVNSQHFNTMPEAFLWLMCELHDSSRASYALSENRPDRADKMFERVLDMSLDEAARLKSTDKGVMADALKWRGLCSSAVEVQRFSKGSEVPSSSQFTVTFNDTAYQDYNVQAATDKAVKLLTNFAEVAASHNLSGDLLDSSFMREVTILRNVKGALIELKAAVLPYSCASQFDITLPDGSERTVHVRYKHVLAIAAMPKSSPIKVLMPESLDEMAYAVERAIRRSKPTANNITLAAIAKDALVHTMLAITEANNSEIRAQIDDLVVTPVGVTSM